MKLMTRRELFNELVSKDTLKQAMRSWYSFSKPLAEESAIEPKKETLLEKVKRLDMKYKKNIQPNRKEG